MADRTLAQIATTSTAASLLAGDRFYMLRSGVDFSLPGSVIISAIASAVSTSAATKEASLGNPAVTGYILSSTTSGVRSWIALPSSDWGSITGIPSAVSTFGAAGILSGALGGTGVANTGKTFTIGGNWTHAGAHTVSLTTTSNTALTLPTSGTLATRAGVETLTNKAIESSEIGGSVPAPGSFTELYADIADLRAITVNGGTVNTHGAQFLLPSITDTTSRPFLITQTWDNAALDAIGVLVNITSADSGAGSLLQAWQLDGGTVASVDTSGRFLGSGSGLTSLNASSITSGTVPPARMGTGTADNTTFLRGDNTWQVPAGGSGAPFDDATAIIKGSADATKLGRFEVDGLTTGTTRVLTWPNFDGTIATLAGAETLTNKVSITSETGIFTQLTTNLFDAQSFAVSGAAANTTAAQFLLPTITDTTSRPLLITQTWSNAGLTATGLKLNVTDDNSAAGSLLADFQVGGVSKASISKAGALTAASSVTASTVTANSLLQIFTSPNNRLLAGDAFAGIAISSDYALGWSGTTAAAAARDLAIVRKDAGVLGITDASTGGGILEFPQVASGGTVAANSARIYALDNAGTAALYTKNEAGTEAIISPHDYSAPTSLYDASPLGQDHLTRERNEYTGQTRWTNYTRAAKRLEAVIGAVQDLITELPAARRTALMQSLLSLTPEQNKLVHEEDFASTNARLGLTGNSELTAKDWDTEQESQSDRREKEREDWAKRKADAEERGGDFKEAEPERFIPKGKPEFLKNRQ